VSFEGIIGHERPIGILQRAIRNGTLAHAYLFSGDGGIGKKLTAFALAAAVNCREEGTGDGCGKCPACRQISAGTHPDVHVVLPESENKQFLATLSTKEAEKASSEIKIDQIRDAQASISLMPSDGSVKFLIIDGADTLNAAAQNAFLKTLEEPPGQSVIIMLSSRPQSLLPTIRSRCQEIRFLPLPRRELAQALTERRNLSEDDAWFLAALAQGSMGRGLEMDVRQEREARTELAALRSALREMGAGEIVARAETLSRDREGFERLLDIGIEQLRDALVLHESGDEKLLVDGRGADFHREWAERTGRQRLVAELELFSASRGLLDRRVAGQLVAENLLLSLGRPY